MSVIRIKIDEAYLPSSTKEKSAKVIATVKSGDSVITSKSTPVGSAVAEKALVNEGIEAAIVGVVQRASKKGMDSKEIAEIVDLGVDSVDAILKGEPPKDMQSPTIFQIEATLFLALPRGKLETAVLEIVVANPKDKSIASHSVNVADVVANAAEWKKENHQVACKGACGDVPLDIQISFHGTAQMTAEEQLNFNSLV